MENDSNQPQNPVPPENEPALDPLTGLPKGPAKFPENPPPHPGAPPPATPAPPPTPPETPAAAPLPIWQEEKESLIKKWGKWAALIVVLSLLLIFLFPKKKPVPTPAPPAQAPLPPAPVVIVEDVKPVETPPPPPPPSLPIPPPAPLTPDPSEFHAIELANGTVIEGRIVREDDAGVTIDVRGMGPIVFGRFELASEEKSAK